VKWALPLLANKIAIHRSLKAFFQMPRGTLSFAQCWRSHHSTQLNLVLTDQYGIWVLLQRQSSGSLPHVSPSMWMNTMRYPVISQHTYRLTETVVIAVHDDKVHEIDNWQVCALLLLDLSATFDTVDHDTLRQVLSLWLGVQGSMMAWFDLYLTNRMQTRALDLL